MKRNSVPLMVSNTAKNLAMTRIKDYFHLNVESNEALSGTPRIDFL